MLTIVVSFMSISIQWEAKGLFIEAHNEVYFDELASLFLTETEDPRYQDSQYTLFDASNVEFISMDIDKLGLIAKVFLGAKSRTTEFKFAIILKAGSVEKEVEKYLSLTRSSSRQSHCFHSLLDARQWLEQT